MIFPRSRRVKRDPVILEIHKLRAEVFTVHLGLQGLRADVGATHATTLDKLERLTQAVHYLGTAMENLTIDDDEDDDTPPESQPRTFGKTQ